ncbi:MAG TPA: indolepyruvate oxidoreductase subunit beta [Thermoleophilia bacterium]|nr:indolepyruvate oxidoreductase subunit beta [Thermoleophilia bacterium]
MSDVTTVDLAGVGGQGIILGAALLSRAALLEGYDVKASEVKGMAQRGGSVVSTVRFGRRVLSPIALTADIVIATELLEGRRALAVLVPRGTMVCATTRIAPGEVLRGEEDYPDDIEQEARRAGVRLLLVEAEELASRAGTVRAANVALLGAASAVLPFGEAAWRTALEEVLPATILAVNLTAFALGRESVQTPAPAARDPGGGMQE